MQELPLVLMRFLRVHHGQFLAGSRGGGAALLTCNFCGSQGITLPWQAALHGERVSEPSVTSMPV